MEDIRSLSPEQGRIHQLYMINTLWRSRRAEIECVFSSLRYNGQFRDLNICEP